MKDVCYAALFDKKDMPYIYRLAEEIRATHNQDLVNEFNNSLEKRWNDHHPPMVLDVSKADDLVVNAGVDQCIDLILGSNANVWRYMARGTGGSTAPAVSDTTLTTESGTRIDMSTSGWRESAGTSLRFAGIHGESVPTMTVSEAGVFTASSAGIMLNRNGFSNFPLSHTINITGFVISCIVEFVPVM